MAPHKTITVNGRVYDATTGLPVESSKQTKKPAATEKAHPPAKDRPKAPRPAGTPRPDFVKVSAKTARPTTPKPAAQPKKAPASPRPKTASTTVHGTVQRSQTLNRRATKKPAPVQRAMKRTSTVGKQMDVAKHGSVSRFAQHPETQKPQKSTPATTKADTAAQTHPVAARALAKSQPKKAKTAPASAKQTKDDAISKALNTPKHTPKKDAAKNKKRLRTILTISGLVLLVAAALFSVYYLVPSISVNIASTRAGISATYPEYTPDGYRLSQPVEFSDGEVILKFDSNSNDNYYTVTQTRSSWDSTAVLDSVVTPAAGADYVTTKERGLTIYTYDSSAVWVNGGILYQIDSQAPLSGDQIRQIATSL